jgi:hypothetical protein
MHRAEPSPFSGAAAQDQILTVANTLSDHDGMGAVTYVWQTSNDGLGGWADIAGANTGNWLLTQAQVGKFVRAVASYVDGGGTAEHVASIASGQVANLNDVPTGSVALTGVPTQGQVLTASHTIVDTDGLGSMSYQWQASVTGTDGWIDIEGASGSTLTLTQAQVNQYVRAIASYTDGGGTV